MNRANAINEALFCGMHTPDQRDEMLVKLINDIYDSFEGKVNSDSGYIMSTYTGNMQNIKCAACGEPKKSIFDECTKCKG